MKRVRPLQVARRFVGSWRTPLGVALALCGFAAMAATLSSGLGLIDLAHWAASQQRAFHAMVGELLSIQGNGVLAAGSLISACLLYGFLHAAVPGHGKFLIAGAGLASRIDTMKLVGLSMAASLMQAVTAVVLVYGSFALLDITVGWAMNTTTRVLIPLSYVAIFAVGLVLIHRSVKGFNGILEGFFPRRQKHSGCSAHQHHQTGAVAHEHGRCGCGHRHGPTPGEAAAITSWRDAALLIAGIGVRPCTGAIFVLVAAWRMDLLFVGGAAATAMALGTGAFISLVAVSATAARGATFFAAGRRNARIVAPILQLSAGAVIVLLSALFLTATFAT
ncbi:MAG: hypothetical protein AAGJ94_16005 [Pseudomonadota bacterium]